MSIFDFFVRKTAGTIQVPTDLLKEIQDWSVGYYAKHMVGILDAMLTEAKNRITIKKDSENIGMKSLQVADIIANFIESSEPNKDIDSLYSWFETNGELNIPFFESIQSPIYKSFIDSSSGNKPSILTVTLQKSKNGTYFLAIETNPTSEIPTVEKFTRGWNKLQPEQLQMLLSEHLDLIDEIVNEFNEFTLYGYDLLADDRSKKLIMKRQEMLALVKLGKSTEPEEDFFIPTKQMPYLNKLPDNLRLWIHAKFIRSSAAQESEVSKDWLGFWEADKFQVGEDIAMGTIAVSRDIPKDVEMLRGGGSFHIINDGITQIKDTVRHELIHFMQDAISTVKNLPENSTGMPRRKHRNKYDPLGFLKEKDIKDDLITDEIVTRLPHESRDVEFYTRLSDTIAEFNRMKTRLPVELHVPFAKAWIGELTYEKFVKLCSAYIESHKETISAEQKRSINYILSFYRNHDNSHYFDSLKSNTSIKEYRKYQKAVKEFYKAINV